MVRGTIPSAIVSSAIPVDEDTPGFFIDSVIERFPAPFYVANGHGILPGTSTPRGDGILKWALMGLAQICCCFFLKVMRFNKSNRFKYCFAACGVCYLSSGVIGELFTIFSFFSQLCLYVLRDLVYIRLLDAS